MKAIHLYQGGQVNENITQFIIKRFMGIERSLICEELKESVD